MMRRQKRGEEERGPADNEISGDHRHVVCKPSSRMSGLSL